MSTVKPISNNRLHAIVKEQLRGLVPPNAHVIVAAAMPNRGRFRYLWNLHTHGARKVERVVPDEVQQYILVAIEGRPEDDRTNKKVKIVKVFSVPTRELISRKTIMVTQKPGGQWGKSWIDKYEI